MQAPRWLWFTASLLAVNVVLVAATSIRAHLFTPGPQDAQQAGPPPKNAADGQEDPIASELDVVRPPALAGLNGPTASDADPLAELDSDLPAVPSLQDAHQLKSDPVYQEIRKMFSEEGGELEAPPLAQAFPQLPTPSAAVPTAPSKAYFRRLDQRLTTTTQLCSSAQALASEAEDYASQGNAEAAAELLIMATELREMAADLLVRPL